MLTINFSSEVYFPSYLKKKFESKPEESRRERRQRRLKIFFTEEASFVVNPNQGIVDPNENSSLCEKVFSGIE